MPVTGTLEEKKQKRRSYNANYYAKNREKLIAEVKAYTEKNKESYKQGQAEYRKRNKEKLNEACREWYANNSDKVAKYRAANKDIKREQGKAWWAANQDKMKEWKRINAEKIRGYEAKWRNANKDKVNAKTGRRNAARVRATPAWADEFIVAEMYSLAQLRKRVMGFAWHVDHIVPLRSRLVCGLHCEANLRVIPGKENVLKNNRYWPDMPV